MIECTREPGAECDGWKPPSRTGGLKEQGRAAAVLVVIAGREASKGCARGEGRRV